MRYLIYVVMLGLTAGFIASYGTIWAQGGGNHEPDDGKGTGGPGSPVHIVSGYCNACGFGDGHSTANEAGTTGVPGIY